MRAELTALAQRPGTDELMIATNVGDHALRRRSYALLAEAFDLAPESAHEAAPTLAA